MRVINYPQGSEGWLAERRKFRTASEASVMMSVSSYAKRSDLIEIRATGIEKEIDYFLQNIFDKGHEVEAKARPIAEKIIGEELYPVTGALDEKNLLASFDGVTLLGNIIWECKQTNASKIIEVNAGNVPACDYYQVQQQLLVSKAEKCLYMVTDGTEDNSHYCWCYPDPEAFKKIILGWEQFDVDLKEWKPSVAKTEVIGKAPDSLPALHIEVTGMVTASNLKEFKEHALSVINGINTELSTDEDFANAEKTAKWCKKVEEKLLAAKDHALSQTATIDEMFRTLDKVISECKQKRTGLTRLVANRKTQIKTDLVLEAKANFDVWAEKKDKDIAPCSISSIRPDFGAAIKGKKTMDSVRSAIDDLMAESKIKANDLADLARTNISFLYESAKDYEFLFKDLAVVGLKQEDDFKAMLSSRIAEYKEEKTRNDAAAKKAEQEKREKIAKEEREKILVAENAKAAAKEVVSKLEENRQSVQRGGGSSVAKKTRPTDNEIILCIAKTFGVSQEVAVKWLSEMNMEALE